MTVPREVFISVDVEASGPIPGIYSLMTIGACAIDDPEKSFSVRIKPIGDGADPEAMKVTGMSLADLRASGLEPAVAMSDFAGWVRTLLQGDAKPVFVGLNAPFDWSFVNYYFHRFLGENPFGFTALDIKAFYMGATGCRWDETKSSAMTARLNPKTIGTHDALQDAIHQAEIFRLVRRLAPES